MPLNTSKNRFKVAYEFARLLHKHIGLAKVKRAAKLNKKNPHKAHCHTHDFCDPNDLMDVAIYNVTGTKPSDKLPWITEDISDLWNEAWNIAKVVDFNLVILKLTTRL